MIGLPLTDLDGRTRCGASRVHRDAAAGYRLACWMEGQARPALRPGDKGLLVPAASCRPVA
jgi:hypothetical protein